MSTMATVHLYPSFSIAMSSRIDDAGGDIITGTTTKTGRWRKVVALTDCSFAAATVSDDLSGTFDGLQLKSGTELIGIFSSIQLASGSLAAYK